MRIKSTGTECADRLTKKSVYIRRQFITSSNMIKIAYTEIVPTANHHTIP